MELTDYDHHLMNIGDEGPVMHLLQVVLLVGVDRNFFSLLLVRCPPPQSYEVLHVRCNGVVLTLVK